jgi:uncharacterized membrane protein YkgB
LVIFWFGYLKFLLYEAEGIQLIVANSPLLSWADQLLGSYHFSRVLGAVEMALAPLLALRPLWPQLSQLGSLGASVIFLTTLSFFITTTVAESR